MIQRQFILFILVGMLNTVFGYAVFSALIYLGLHYVVAVLFATCLSVLFNFKTTGRIVFNSTDNALLLRFIGVNIVLYLLNIALLKLFTYWQNNIYLDGALTIPVSSLASFLLSKYFVFHRAAYETS